ncbi:hypothetical protein IEQ34_001647 [Dendrobium chrysotoxum]|uniref:Prolamin-like domain-containing protein n=1 Tax=Dendrobium chrysotoxum TaxID=161865 RepID=A0AAV7HQM7_DENCH|nr:hypothetical protein IEQ34_001647 [Dendrobium chrysotoxum]
MTAPQTASSLIIGDNLFRCLKAMSSFEGCVPKVAVPVALDIQLQLTPHCCHALKEIREICFPNFYPPFSLGPKLGALFHLICGDYSTPAPQPATIA